PALDQGREHLGVVGLLFECRTGGRVERFVVVPGDHSTEEEAAKERGSGTRVKHGRRILWQGGENVSAHGCATPGDRLRVPSRARAGFATHQPTPWAVGARAHPECMRVYRAQKTGPQKIAHSDLINLSEFRSPSQFSRLA